MRIGGFAVRAVAALALAACSESTDPESESVAITSIAGQLTGVVGEYTESPPNVRISRESDGRPVAGVIVIFISPRQSGTVEIPIDTTDADGIASAGRWRLATSSGLQSIMVHAPAYSEVISLSAVARPGPLSRVNLAVQQNQWVLSGREPVAPSLRASDQYGNGISGVNVAFTTMSGGGTLGLASALTNASGIASAVTWNIPSVEGRYSAEATAASQGFTFTAQRIDSSALVWYALDSMISGRTYLPSEWSIKSKRLGLPYFDPCLCVNKTGAFYESTEYLSPTNPRWETGGGFSVIDGRISMDLVDSVHVAGNSVRVKIRDYYSPAFVTWIYNRRN